MPPALADRVLDTLKAEMRARRLSQEHLAERLSERTGVYWSQSGLGKKLNGVNGMTLADLASICSAIGMSLLEAVRDRGLEFAAEMTPTEVRVLEELRRRPERSRALLVLLSITPDDEAGKPPDPAKNLIRPRRKFHSE